MKAIVTHVFDVSATQLWDLIGDLGMSQIQLIF